MQDKIVQLLRKSVAVAVENGMVVPQKIKHKITIWSRNSTFRYISVPRRTENRDLERGLYTHVRSSIIHNTQKVVEAQVSICGWMEKQNMVYTYNGILFNLKKEGNSDTCYSMDEACGQYAKWNNWDRRGQILYDFSLCELPRVIKFIETESRMVGTSLVAQWLRICLPMQGTRVRALVWEDPTCRGATRPVSHTYWACASGACTSGACAPQQERPR